MNGGVAMKFRLLRLLILVAGIVPALPVLADVPSPFDSTVPDLLTMAARNGSGAVDISFPFSVVIRKLSGRPFANASVVLDFSACPDLRFCTNQGDPNVLTDCGSRTIRAITDNLGQLTFHVC